MKIVNDVAHLECPCCTEPTVPGQWGVQEDHPDGADAEAGWLWYDDAEAKCPGCGCLVGVRVTDDYADDRVAQTYVKEQCPAP